MSIETKTLLETAATILMMPNTWTQGSMARTDSGFLTASSNYTASCFCAVGALKRTNMELDYPDSVLDHAMEILSGKIRGNVFITSFNRVTNWNDAPKRTVTQVVSKMLQAAESIKV